jgi:hypothetical protein
MSPHKAMSAGRGTALGDTAYEAQKPVIHLTSIHACSQSHIEKDGVYFITFTYTNWLLLFKICNACNAV